MVFLKYYFYECFCWVNFDLSACIDEMICWVLYIFVLILVILLFLSAFSNAVSVSSTIITSFFE